MSTKEAGRTLNFYGKQRSDAANNNMDWIPDRKSITEIREAKSKLSTSRNPEQYLTKVGQDLFYSHW